MALINAASSLLTGSSPFPLSVCTAKSADIPMHYCFHPWSRIPRSPLALHVRLIQAYEHETGFRNILEEQYLVDENNLKSIIRNYRLHWKQRLLSMRLHLPDIPSLISGCFSLFSRQFMQIKSTSNKLFILPT